MKKTLLIIIAIFFTTSVYASHGNWTCTKKKSVLHDVNKELGGNGEIVRLNSFTTMGMFNVLNKAYEKNPDDENRLFYVGATRTKEHLHIISPKQEYKGYSIWQTKTCSKEQHTLH